MPLFNERTKSAVHGGYCNAPQNVVYSFMYEDTVIEVHTLTIVSAVELLAPSRVVPVCTHIPKKKHIPK